MAERRRWWNKSTLTHAKDVYLSTKDALLGINKDLNAAGSLAPTARI